MRRCPRLKHPYDGTSLYPGDSGLGGARWNQRRSAAKMARHCGEAASKTRTPTILRADTAQLRWAGHQGSLEIRSESLRLGAWSNCAFQCGRKSARARARCTPGILGQIREGLPGKWLFPQLLECELDGNTFHSALAKFRSLEHQ